MTNHTQPTSAAAKGASASMFGVASRDIKRLNAIVTIIVKHGFGEMFLRTPLGRRFMQETSLSAGGDSHSLPPAVRFRKLLENLGPTYIKFGQILSMRRDVLPLHYIEALEGLQDSTPVVATLHIREVISHGLGRPVEELFGTFDDTPLATASIGQTHRATTLLGEEVVVKVQRPGIEQTMRSDLDLLFILAKMLEASIEEVQLMAPSEMVAEFEKALLRELNFTEEFANLVTARNFLASERSITVPKPYPELSCRTVLTMEFFPGKSLRHLVPQSDQAKHAVEEIFHCSCKQVLIDGFFHADPHMGNILVNEDGLLCMIDLGLVGRLNQSQRADLISLVMGGLMRDAASMARILLHMGTPTERVNIAELKAEIQRIMDQFLTNTTLSEINSSEFANAFIAAAQRFKIKLAKDYALLIKSIFVIEGIVRSLHPELDIIGIIRPYAESIFTQKFSPQHLLQESLGGIGQFAALMRQLPTLLEQMLHDAETGNIQIKAVTPQLDQIAPLLHQLAGRITLAGFAVTMTMTSALLTGWSTPEHSHVLIITATTVAAVITWTVLLAWHFVGRGRPIRARSIVQFFKR